MSSTIQYTFPSLSADARASLLSLPQDWRDSLAAKLADEEEILAFLELDLDAQLRFVPGWLVLTDQRLLARVSANSAWQSWDFQLGLSLRHYCLLYTSRCV